MSFEIKELTRLVEEEKIAEGKIKKAEEKALKIKSEAEKNAQEIIHNAQSGDLLKEIESEKEKEIQRKKQALEKKFKKKVQELKNKAEKRIRESTTIIIEDVLKVEI